MTCKQISNGLIMQPLIVGYWVTLTTKNVVDYVGVTK